MLPIDHIYLLLFELEHGVHLLEDVGGGVHGLQLKHRA
jgi:hypothetical protein